MEPVQMLRWLESQMNALKDNVFVRPPQTIEEFNKLAGQFTAYFNTHAAVKTAMQNQEKQS